MTTEPALTSRGLATRRRIVDAATAEFARHGLAGARIERIVEQANTNKAQLYGYFGSKEQLFDVIFESSLSQLLEVLPIDAEHLAEWAVHLYDQCLARPDLIRIATWHRLERRPYGALVDDLGRLDRATHKAIERAQRAGVLVRGAPFDVIAVVIAMAMTWSPVSTVYSSTTDEDTTTHDARRALLYEAVRGAVSVHASEAPSSTRKRGRKKSTKSVAPG